MRYLIICKDKTSFYTNWYGDGNSFGEYIFCVVDLAANKITFDGKTWKDIEDDHL